MKKNLIAGNWKMNKTPGESIEFVENLIEKLKDKDYDDRDILICPPFTSLFPLSKILQKDKKIKLGAQNVYCEDKGAFTGEISPEMLKEIGVEYVIVGHSERRNIFGETDELINKKLKKVIEYGMKPILCVGEKLEEREEGKTFEVVRNQLENCLKDVKEIENVVIAYEPVWAIGTGKNATPQQAEEVHVFIREWISNKYLQDVAKNLIILYGGSVKPENIDSLMKEKDIDGVLVGGASLNVDSFLRIIDYKGE
ncbi:MAG: triose-phosphate isomerase [Candidatus Omnitrophota bacterium]|nr:MAG: triose-phosphate isomerase [Candidatus Omnitrophota bacterium]